MVNSRGQSISDLTLDDLTDPDQRHWVVEAYKAAGMGGERYGVVHKRCGKRICPQGWEQALTNENSYCQCEDQYYDDVHETIYDIMEVHGLPREWAWRLSVRENMHEAVPTARRRKNA